MTLQEIYLKHKKEDWPDKGSSHSYIEVYEEILAPYRHTAKNILEIGLMSGESLRMWEEYFDGNVYGMDCSETPIDGLADLRPIIAEGTHRIAIGDAANPIDVKMYFDGLKFDVVIEDANHQLQQQLDIYKALKSYLNENAIYIIEDIQNIDKDRKVFEDMDESMQVSIIDRRCIKNRYDDCLVVLNSRKRYVYFDNYTEE